MYVFLFFFSFNRTLNRNVNVVRRRANVCFMDIVFIIRVGRLSGLTGRKTEPSYNEIEGIP